MRQTLCSICKIVSVPAQEESFTCAQCTWEQEDIEQQKNPPQVFKVGDWHFEEMPNMKPEEEETFAQQDFSSMYESPDTENIRAFMNHKSEAPKPYYMYNKESGKCIRMWPPGTYEAEQALAKEIDALLQEGN
jgi:hypothetical protein